MSVGSAFVKRAVTGVAASTITVGGFYNVSHAHFDILTSVPFAGDPFGPNHSGMALGTRGTTSAPSILRWQ
ncbi:hypothetical protein [Actinomadura sp. DC4]|uniref:hypothetical protein n=1 Tax=Actinomadura sp. DC4 TaxID=3055069 RepID=UPI0025B12278|nr:hypothetical protein [Actinomadura sp. DC4]MDN3352940.1 hypothetical protein [Actinomadura sp. DC4]